MCTPDKSWGIAFINDGKYGYATPDQGFELTLLRKAPLPKFADEAWCLDARRQRVNKNLFVPTSSDDGWHIIRQWIYPHLENWEGACLQQIAHAHNCPIITIPIDKSEFNKPTCSGSKAGFISPLVILPACFELMAIKPWEPIIAQHNAGYILRIINNSTIVQTGEIRFASNLNIINVESVDLLERSVHVDGEAPLTFDRETRTLKTLWKPFEIRSFLLK
jgi:alpha-mannosidase